MQILTSIFDYKDYPKIFKNLDSNKKPLPEILELSNEMKPLDVFFENYKSAYPFQKEKALECIKRIEDSGKIQFHEIFLFWFPEFYSLYKSTFDVILNPNKGCIPITWKYYIGIMAAATNKCQFLFRHLESEFLLSGGDETWLILGLGAVPEKLRKLEKINNILAHQPWKLKETDLIDINVHTNPNYWNLNELVEAILVMVNFHRLSTILESIKLGLGGAKNLLEEFEVFSVEEKLQESKLLKFINDEEIVKNKIINELEILNEHTHLNQNFDNNLSNNPNSFENRNTKGEDGERIKNNENPIGTLNTNNENTPKNITGKRKFSEDNNSSKLNSSFENVVSIEDFSKHISNYCTVYLDFDSHSDNYKSYFVIYFCDN